MLLSLDTFTQGVILSSSVPIPTSLSGCPEQDAEEPRTPDKVVTTPSQRGSIKKAVPDEAMPDLIQLVHGNTSGIKRLIRDFRVFWFKKESADGPVEPSTPKGKLDKSMQETDGEVSFIDESVHENPVEGEIIQGEETGSDQKTDEGKKCSISKRQLEIKINAIAVREKRQALKICWYVHDAVLKEFGLEGLVCNSLVQPEPVVPAESSKETTPAPVRDQRSIMDFALSKEECAKREALLPKAVEHSQPKPEHSNQIAESARQEAVDPKVENPMRSGLQSTPKDSKKGGQMSIMDFAKTGQTKKIMVKDIGQSKPVLMEVDDSEDVMIVENPSDVQTSSSSKVCKKSTSNVTSLTTSSTASSSNTPICKSTSSQVAAPSTASSGDASIIPAIQLSSTNQADSSKATFSQMLGRGVEKSNSNCHATVSRVSSFQVDIGQAVFDLMGNLADGRHSPDMVQTK
ncbi:chromatin assembly factor 1 subunit A [Elysia marginata]|uniref:Chromatin assembly factor 1 subunit A n=1 Tax=Elysia marginata TaxID=1093978 RepID=A0AAV4IMY6_9GAST|nr:chromatin assembly factor 1 subunit A [Elysia marginata]